MEFKKKSISLRVSLRTELPSISLVSSQIVSFLFFVVDVVVSMMILLVGEERADGMRSIFFFFYLQRRGFL